MTSKLTREQLLEIIETDHVQCGEASYLARMALAAMDSEPVAYTDDRNLGYIDRGRETAYLWGKQNSEPADVALYRHAQQPVVDADDNFYSWFGREWQENYQHNQYTTAAKQMLGVMAESAWIAATERQRQKQSVSVPDVKIYEDVPYEVGRFKTHRDCYCDGWNACRAAMLQAGTLTNEDTRQVDELTMWIKRLVRSLKNANPDSKLPREAMDYLTAKGPISVGDILR